MEEPSVTSATKILAGEITIQNFHPLVHHDLRPLSSNAFPARTFTWSLPETYQTVKILNLQKSLAITLRSYKFSAVRDFQWINEESQIVKCSPTVDLRFRDMIQHVRDEFKNQTGTHQSKTHAESNIVANEPNTQAEGTNQPNNEAQSTIVSNEPNTKVEEGTNQHDQP